MNGLDVRPRKTKNHSETGGPEFQITEVKIIDSKKETKPRDYLEEIALSSK